MSSKTIKITEITFMYKKKKANRINFRNTRLAYASSDLPIKLMKDRKY